uniref:C-type mannose receptor 2 n=1 Tax=Cucumis melo TaxID=3656 RepID=A0A9I9D8I3_CUCME
MATAVEIGNGGSSSSSSKSRRSKQIWYSQPLTPLMEGPDPQFQDQEPNKKDSSGSNWEFLRDWFKIQRNLTPSISQSSFTNLPNSKTQDLKLLLGVLACPLAPIPLHSNSPPQTSHFPPHIPLETSVAHYIIQQYLAATGCLKQQKCAKNMYATGSVKMIRCETEVSSGKSVKTVGTRCEDTGCFVLWQMLPAMWSLELVVGGSKVVAGSDGNTVWRHTPWLGTHAAKGPQRPLRRIIQVAPEEGLDPKSTARLFEKAQCLGEKRIGEDDCFVLKVSAEREAVMERNEGPAEVIRHVLYGYFCQKSGVLVYLEDSHLTRVQTEGDAVYWETTIGSCIGDYRDVDGVLIAHRGRSIATVFKFGEMSTQFSRTRMEEIWSIDDVMFNVAGLSMDYFIPPADIFDSLHSHSHPHSHSHSP